MTSPVETFQIPLEAAELYEAKFVPAIFADWAPPLVTAAGVVPGQTVLDVACGTGIVARVAADRIGGQGKVVGLDLNQAMLTVARRIRPDIEWHQGDAADLPFADDTFDVALCQAAMMFFPDRVAALTEMRRVVRPGGTVAVNVPGRLEASLGYADFVEIAAKHAGPEAKTLLTTYFVLGDLDELVSLFEEAGLQVTSRSAWVAVSRADSVDDFVSTEIYGSPLGERISDEVYQRILKDTRVALAPFVTSDGLEGPTEVAQVTATA